MKHLSTLIVIIAIAALISACGGQAQPTLTSDQIAATAQAAAFTIIAQTQAAQPTATVAPPTETPTLMPTATNTTAALPVLDGGTSPTVAVGANNPGNNPGGPTVDPCANRVLGKPLGHPTVIRIWNNTKTPITVSLYLNSTKGHQECGYRSYNLSKNADVVITDLVWGCYNLWAWNSSGKPNFNSSGYGCINNPDKWTFEVTTAVIKFTGP